MAKRPFPQESGTSSPSLGDAICGEPEKATERWANYANESVIGSGDVASYPVIQEMGRATGQALPGESLLESVPGSQEIETCGKSLGDMTGGKDEETAKKRRADYAENSTVDSINEDIHGNHEHAEKLPTNSEKSQINEAVTAATADLTFTAGGLAAPYGIGAAATVEDYVVDGFDGGIAGAASGAVQANAYEKVNVAETDAYYLKENEKYLTGKKDATQTLMTYKTKDGTRGGSLGFSARERARMYEQVKDKDGNILSKHRSANYAGSPSYPKGYDNVSRMFQNPSVKRYLKLYGEAKPPKQNCGEPNAFETIKANNPGATIESQYTLRADSDGKITVKGRCKNCKAAGDNYGRAPFEKYDGRTVDDAIEAHVGEAEKKCSKSAANRTRIVAKAAKLCNWFLCSQCGMEYEDEENAKNK